jgi:hypothetical protein
VTTFEQAQDVVRKQLAGTQYLFIADWGQESDDYWLIMAGDRRYLAEFNDDFAQDDDICHLVSKKDGTYEFRSYAGNLEFFDSFKPYGKVPDYFQ